MLTPSLVLAYWICGSIAQPFYDMAGLSMYARNRAKGGLLRPRALIGASGEVVSFATQKRNGANSFTFLRCVPRYLEGSRPRVV